MAAPPSGEAAPPSGEAAPVVNPALNTDRVLPVIPLDHAREEAGGAVLTPVPTLSGSNSGLSRASAIAVITNADVSSVSDRYAWKFTRAPR